MKPTYEELEASLKNTEAKLAETQNLLKLAIDRITVLEERLNKNSKNSSKPPSTDQKSNSSKEGKEKKTRKGMSRAILPADQIDYFHTCELKNCPHCGSDELTTQEDPLILQQVELPEAKAYVTQFNCIKYSCLACAGKATADLPKGVPNSAFGPRLMALVATLTGVFHLAKREAMQLVQDLYNVNISEGSVINVEERVAIAIHEVYERIHRCVMQGMLPKHFDETSWRDRGKTCWAWVASTANAVCFRIDANRSRAAFQRFTGTLGPSPVITDRYGAYSHLEGPHQYCLAHLIRDFHKYAERKTPDGEIGRALEEELRQICRTQRKFREGIISKRSRDTRFRHQKKRLSEHLIDGLANGTDDLSGLCERLWDNMHKLWTFSDFINVDPTNNLAERDLRRLVLWRKKSYGTRSSRGQYFVERISTVTGTLKKSGKNILSFITKAIKAFYEGKSSPLILSSGCF